MSKLKEAFEKPIRSVVKGNSVTGSESVPPLSEKELKKNYLEGLAQLRAQVNKGKSKYKSTLMTFNGRGGFWDAKQEAVDLLQYCIQGEREAVKLIEYITVLEKFILNSDMTNMLRILKLRKQFNKAIKEK